MAEKNKKIADIYKMFRWTALDSKGVTVKGCIRAENINQANSLVTAKGLNIVKIRQKPILLLSREEQKAIKQEEINLFFRQLSTMLNAGIPLAQALEFVSGGVESLKMASLITQLFREVSSGRTLASALERYPKFFDGLICSLVKVGEQSGTLDSVLLRIATYLERMASLKAKVKKALYYPVMVFVVMIGLAVMLLTFIVPRFQGMFKSFGKELPGPTQVIINLSNFLQNYWWLIIVIVVLVVALHIIFKRQYLGYNIFLARTSLKLPIFGNLIKKAIIARSVRTLSVTLSAGVPLSEALTSTARVANNLIYQEALETIRDRVVVGEKMGESMQATDLFPNMVVQMVGVGEHAGTLESMLGKVADFYDEQVNNAVESLSSLIEPIMILLLGVIVGGFVISMYLPIFKIGTLV